MNSGHYVCLAALLQCIMAAPALFSDWFLVFSKNSYLDPETIRSQNYLSRLELDGAKIDKIYQARLLGLFFRDDLSLKSNNDELTRKAYTCMIILKRLYQVDVPIEELLEIYIFYIKSVVVWSSSLTKCDLVSTQKVAIQIKINDYPTLKKYWSSKFWIHSHPYFA